MTFDDLKIKNIDYVVRFTSSVMNFSSKNKKNHILGLKLSGESEHRYADRTMPLSEGYIYFLNQAEDYDVRTDTKGVAFSVHFTTYEPIETPSFSIKPADTSEIYRLLCKIEKQAPVTADSHRMCADFYSLCSIFSTLRKQTYAKSDSRITAAKEYLDSRFTEDGCLDGAAKVCGVTRRRFCDIFAARYGITPGRYVTVRRIEYAKKLLSSKELSVSDAAELCGFSDVYYFSKVFKREAGTTPSEYI